MAKMDGLGAFTSNMFVLYEDGHPIAYDEKKTFWFMDQKTALTFMDEWKLLRSRPVSAVPIVGYENQILLAEELDKFGINRIALNAKYPGPFIEVDTKDYVFYVRKKLSGDKDCMN